MSETKTNARAGKPAKAPAVRKPRAPRKRVQEIPESYELVVTCRDESDQRQLYERLAGDGYSCRVLTM